MGVLLQQVRPCYGPGIRLLNALVWRRWHKLRADHIFQGEQGSWHSGSEQPAKAQGHGSVRRGEDRA